MSPKNIKNIRWRPLYYHLKHRYATVQNSVVAVAIVVALGWVWGSVSMMQRNYELQRRLDTRERELQLRQLEVEMLGYEKAFYQTREFQELAARQYLGLVEPGEHALVLPPNSPEAKADDEASQATVAASQPSNFEQWVNFLSGRTVRSLSSDD